VIVVLRHNDSIHLHLLRWFKMFWFFCSHASTLKITYSLCVTPDRRRYDRPFLHLSNGATFSSTASCWILQSKFSIDPSKTNFPWMFKKSMQQRCSIAPPRFSVLQCLHFHPRRYILVLHMLLEIMSIFLYKNILTILRVESNHLLCHQESIRIFIVIFCCGGIRYGIVWWRDRLVCVRRE